ncbi:MAG: TM2 domain-containing protein [Bacteroidota bacterium]|nr:TM2 domain-containing protein [Bacteroidota bacterium]MDE2956627.1 TM2 domain-containing protein [Bacteroidota bacterium]
MGYYDLEPSEKDFLPTLLLCLILGAFGAHRFYVGKIGTAVLMIVTLGGLGIWVIVDLIFIVCGSFRDAHGRTVAYPFA